MKLEADEVAFHPFSNGDSTGRVFSWDGAIYRAISAERAPFFEDLLSQGILRDLMRRQLLVDTEITDLELDSYSLIVQHRTVPFPSRCYEWCGEMLRAAALSVLELARELLKHGLTLQDAHPYNVLFSGPIPIWVDLGSLVPVCRGAPWPPYDEFLAYYTRPLQIIEAGHGDIARCLLRGLLRKEASGIEQRDVELITGANFAKILRTAKAGAKAVARRAVPPILRPVASRAIRSIPRSIAFGGTTEPLTTIDSAAEEIKRIRLAHAPIISADCSNTDFPDFVMTTNWTEKHHTIAKILFAEKPRSVLDIGSSRGWYSQLAARNGAQVVSVDFDEPSVTQLFFDALKGQLPILPLVADFRSLNPMLAWATPPGTSYVDRFRCDMVLALGLVHHLVFEQRLNLDLIICGLSAFTRKYLAVEFVDREDQYVSERLDTRFSWYSLEKFLAKLRQEFRQVDEFPSNGRHRWILLCVR